MDDEERTTRLDGTPVEVEVDGAGRPLIPAGARFGQPTEDGLGRWEVLSPLMAGGMGTVYRGRDRRLSTDVAIKLLKGSEDDPKVRRFRREARELGQMRHPNVVRVLDHGYENGIAFLVMELLEGEDLEGRIVNGGVYTEESATEIYRVAGLIGHALCVAHKRGVVHRDIKPANIFLRRDGAEVVPVLVDFGIVGWYGERLSASKTNRMTVGAIVGTAGFMSLEQINGEQVGPETDLYALGAVVYFCLTCAVPYDETGEDASYLQMLASIQKQMSTPNSLSIWEAKLPSWLPDEVREVLVKALNPDKEQRGTMEGFVEVMTRHGKVNLAPRTPTPPQAPGTVDLNAATHEHVPAAAPSPQRKRKPSPASYAISALAGLGIAFAIAGVSLLRGKTPNHAGARDAAVALPTPTVIVPAHDAGVARDVFTIVDAPVVADATPSADAPVDEVEDVGTMEDSSTTDTSPDEPPRRHGRHGRRPSRSRVEAAPSRSSNARRALEQQCCEGIAIPSTLGVEACPPARASRDWRRFRCGHH